MSSKKKESLILKGETITTMEQLRKNLDKEDVMNALFNGTLETWLSQNNYEDKEEEIKTIKKVGDFCINQLYEILEMEEKLVENTAELEKSITEQTEKNKKIKDTYSFTEVIHERLKWYCWDTCDLPDEYPDFKEKYCCHFEAVSARRLLAGKICIRMRNLFCPDNWNNIALKTAMFYSEKIKDVFDEISYDLERLCDKKGKSGLFIELKFLVENSEKHLREMFEMELKSNRHYYSASFPKDLIDEMPIKEHDYRTETGILRFFEGWIPGKIEYTIEDFWVVVMAVQSIIDKMAKSFQEVAHKEYKRFVSDI